MNHVGMAKKGRPKTDGQKTNNNNNIPNGIPQVGRLNIRKSYHDLLDVDLEVNCRLMLKDLGITGGKLLQRTHVI